jgi:hypothetical protein
MQAPVSLLESDEGCVGMLCLADVNECALKRWVLLATAWPSQDDCSALAPQAHHGSCLSLVRALINKQRL